MISTCSRGYSLGWFTWQRPHWMGLNRRAPNSRLSTSSYPVASFWRYYRCSIGQLLKAQSAIDQQQVLSSHWSPEYRSRIAYISWWEGWPYGDQPGSCPLFCRQVGLCRNCANYLSHGLGLQVLLHYVAACCQVLSVFYYHDNERTSFSAIPDHCSDSQQVRLPSELPSCSSFCSNSTFWMWYVRPSYWARTCLDQCTTRLHCWDWSQDGHLKVGFDAYIRYWCVFAS